MITQDINPITENSRNGRAPENRKPLDFSEIKALVQRYRVCWEVHPEEALVSCRLGKQVHVEVQVRKIGFALELYGTFEEGAERFPRQFQDYRKVQLALEKTADWILPRVERSCIMSVDSDIQEVIFSHQRAERPDICVTIRILHQNGWDQPIDKHEERCLKDIEKCLEELGACRGVWSSRSGESVVYRQGTDGGR